MMECLFHLCFFFLCLLGQIGAGQEHYEVQYLYDPDTSAALQGMMPYIEQVPLAVSVNDADLPKVSTSILQAEAWLRTHVLSHFPAANIITIVVGSSVLCNRSQEDKLGLVLPSLKNIFHSLTRWGLEREITVSTAFSLDCYPLPNSASFSPDFADKFVKPLMGFLQKTNSTHSLIPSPSLLPLSNEEAKSLVASHMDSLEKLGFSSAHKINMMLPITEEIQSKHLGRKLSFISTTFADPFPERPTPIPELPQSPNKSPLIGFPAPLSPMAAASSPAYSFSPRQPPVVTVPARSPHVYGFAMPPCTPIPAKPPVRAPQRSRRGTERGLWCVAKPSVPGEILQVAMDYACGAGGADCQAIKPNGMCYFPDTAVAHASYAFNSYWQKNKGKGGTCNFGGTAMIVNSDPSFLHCRFALN